MYEVSVTIRNVIDEGEEMLVEFGADTMEDATDGLFLVGIGFSEGKFLFPTDIDDFIYDELFDLEFA
jgi:hypothetical protein